MKYTTQMDAARKGIITEQMKIVAEKEKMVIVPAFVVRQNK